MSRRGSAGRVVASVVLTALAAAGCSALPGDAGSGPVASGRAAVERATLLDRRGDVEVAPRYRSGRWAALRASSDARRVELHLDGAAEVLTVTVRTRGRTVRAPRGTRREVRVSLFGAEAITNLVGLPARGRVLVEPEDAELGPTSTCAGASATVRGRRVVLTAPFACLGEQGARRTRTSLHLRSRTGAARLTDTTRLSPRLAAGPAPHAS